jgi:hypothetical protein
MRIMTLAAAAIPIALMISPAPPPASPPLTESSPANQVAITLNTIGEADYATTFAGVLPTNGNHVTVFTVGRASPFLAYARSLAGTSVAIADVVVRRSFADLADITGRIAADAGALAHEGIDVQSFGPVPAANAVRLVLAPAPALRRETTARYVSAAQGTFDEMFGPGSVAVASTTEPLAQTAAARDSDSKPFTGGDGTQDPSLGTGCTDSWAVKTSRGQAEVLSAGHCGVGAVYINGGIDLLGRVKLHYVGSDYDYETIATSEQARIWKKRGTRYAVVGWTDPGIGSRMSVNGDVSGEHNSQKVTGQDECVAFVDSHYGTYIVCGIGEVSNSTTAICHHGDSGGPAYVRNKAGTGVYAAGTIEGLNSGGKNCFFESVIKETGHSHLTLLKSKA